MKIAKVPKIPFWSFNPKTDMAMSTISFLELERMAFSIGHLLGTKNFWYIRYSFWACYNPIFWS